MKRTIELSRNSTSVISGSWNMYVTTSFPGLCFFFWRRAQKSSTKLSIILRTPCRGSQRSSLGRTTYGGLAIAAMTSWYLWQNELCGLTSASKSYPITVVPTTSRVYRFMKSLQRTLPPSPMREKAVRARFVKTSIGVVWRRASRIIFDCRFHISPSDMNTLLRPTSLQRSMSSGWGCLLTAGFSSNCFPSWRAGGCPQRSTTGGGGRRVCGMSYLGIEDLYHPVSETEYEDDVRLHALCVREDQPFHALLFDFT